MATGDFPCPSLNKRLYDLSRQPLSAVYETLTLIRGSLISATVRHFISVVQAQFESVSGEAIESHLKLLVPTVARPRW